jgi:cytochrome c-type biogenesis protein CcmH
MTLLLVLALLQVKIPDAQQIVGAPQGAPLSGAMLEQRTTEVAGLLRCPVCQGMSVADSPSTVAVDMKHQVRDLLARGYTESQILRYFETSYGQFVLLKPKFAGVNALVWLLPLIALLAGAALVFVKMRKLEQPLPPPPPADDAYLDRVRKLVDSE